MARWWLNQRTNWLLGLVKLREKVQISITVCHLLEEYTVYLKLHIARNILVTRLLVACLKPLHSYVKSEGLLQVHSYSSLDPNSEPI